LLYPKKDIAFVVEKHGLPVTVILGYHIVSSCMGKKARVRHLTASHAVD
jgi:hypothetical protein